jgi:thioredoxin-related protein
MIKLRHLFFLLFIPTIWGSFTSFSGKEKPTKSIKIGKQAPLKDKKLQNIDANSYSLVDLKKEKGLLVIFSCNTCPFVVGNEKFAGWEVQYNDLSSLADSLGVGMTLINSNEGKRENEDSFDAMKIRGREKGYTMSYLLDTNSEMADAFGAKTTPHVYLFDADLKLVYTGSIDNSWDGQRTEDLPFLENALKELSNGSKISTKESLPRGCSIKRIKK